MCLSHFRGLAAILAAVVLVMAANNLSAEELTPSAETFFDATFGDLTEELDLLEEEGKIALMVMFETEDCPWCARMKKQVLNRVAVQDYYEENFRVISLDAEGDVRLFILNAEAQGTSFIALGRGFVAGEFGRALALVAEEAVP